MGCDWNKVDFGKTGLRVSPIGIGSSYGVGPRELMRAFDRGINFYFWGLRRRGDFGSAIRTLARTHRDEMVVAIQSYSRVGWMMRGSVERALKELEIDRVDLLCLGWWQSVPPPRILDAARALKESGKVRHVMISCHDRPQFEAQARVAGIDAIMVRYNAAHTGAEREVFPQIEGTGTGVLAFTATRWGSLLKPSLTPEGERAPRGRDCYRFVLSEPHVHSTLCGPKNGEELDEAMAALDEGPMTADELAWMRRVGKAVRGETKKKRPLDLVEAVRGASVD